MVPQPLRCCLEQRAGRLHSNHLSSYIDTTYEENNWNHSLISQNFVVPNRESSSKPRSSARRALGFDRDLVDSGVE